MDAGDVDMADVALAPRSAHGGDNDEIDDLMFVAASEASEHDVRVAAAAAAAAHGAAPGTLMAGRRIVGISGKGSGGSGSRQRGHAPPASISRGAARSPRLPPFRSPQLGPESAGASEQESVLDLGEPGMRKAMRGRPPAVRR
jgi:hypothetical protein